MKKKITMLIDFSLILKKESKDNEVYNINLGPFIFKKGEKTIPFNMQDYSYSQSKYSNTLNIEWYSESDASLRGIDIAADIDDSFDKEYLKAGFTRNDITAKFLAEADSIEEIKICIDKENLDNTDEIPKFELINDNDYIVKVNRISFIDENKKEHVVKNKVINKFNDRNIEIKFDKKGYVSVNNDYLVQCV